MLLHIIKYSYSLLKYFDIHDTFFSNRVSGNIAACIIAKWGFCKVKKFQKSKIPMEVGGWVGPDLTRMKHIIGKSSQIKFCVCPFCTSMPVCILFVCTLLNVVCHYDFSDVSPDKNWIRVGCGERYQFFL